MQSAALELSKRQSLPYESESKGSTSCKTLTGFFASQVRMTCVPVIRTWYECVPYQVRIWYGTDPYLYHTRYGYGTVPACVNACALDVRVSAEAD